MQKGKYNRDYHICIINNLQAQYYSKFHEVCKLPEEHIYDLFQEYYFDEDSHNATLEAMRQDHNDDKYNRDDERIQ